MNQNKREFILSYIRYAVLGIISYFMYIFFGKKKIDFKKQNCANKNCKTCNENVNCSVGYKIKSPDINKMNKSNIDKIQKRCKEKNSW